MCKKLWQWLGFIPADPPPPTGGPKKTALLFAINDYPGSQNDLNGCLNDQRDVANKLKEFPGFEIKKFSDSDVTRSRFISEIEFAIGNLAAGDVLLVHYSGHGTQTTDIHHDEDDGYDEAVYLYDGMVIDDDIGAALMSIPVGATVVLMFDSCFSGTVTRALNKKNRYVQNPLMKKRSWKRHRFLKTEMKWIVLSGCGEQQTSADAFIRGEFHGAFTYFALQALKPGMTYREWITELSNYLPSDEYDQAPTLEGMESLFDKKVLT